ncbi:MAG: hypothetical protein WDW36_008283 [Sanguina aurantia]
MDLSVARPATCSPAWVKASEDKTLHGWLKALYPIWAHLTGEDVYCATAVSMAELLLSGCTTSSDHLYIYPNDVLLDDTIRAARDLGLRFHAVRGGMSAGLSKGGIAPDSAVEEEGAILLDMQRCIEAFHDNERYSMLRVAVGPASQKTVTNALMSASATLARRHAGVRLHTHLAENQEDITYTQELYGYRFAQYIRNVGWDRDDCWFAHCCMLNGSEQAMFASNGIGVAHCPSSNTRLASGIAPVRALLDAGVNVGLGVDGAASNDCQSLLAEARLAMLLQRAGGDPAGCSAREALMMATKGGARNLGRDDIGELAPGFAADFVSWKFRGGADPVAALLLAAPAAGPVSLSVINGRVIVRDGEILGFDLPALVADGEARSARLVSMLTPAAIGAGAV